ncbi:MAG: hypothetical protein LCH89_06700 [Proteobacteria bacterium]|nr:hypothetical protein [Pseudomonadota bacterium]
MRPITPLPRAQRLAEAGFVVAVPTPPPPLDRLLGEPLPPEQVAAVHACIVQFFLERLAP